MPRSVESRESSHQRQRPKRKNTTHTLSNESNTKTFSNNVHNSLPQKNDGTIFNQSSHYYYYSENGDRSICQHDQSFTFDENSKEGEEVELSQRLTHESSEGKY